MSVKVTQGTETTIYSTANAGTEIQIVKLDVGSGTAVSDFGGTITAVDSVANVAKGTVTSAENLVKGTITRVEGGTIGEVSNLATGTIAAVTNVTFGTIDTFYRHPDGFATTVSSGTSTLGTIKAAVSGSVIYVTDITVSAGTATNVEIASGGTSTPIIGTLHLADNGGAVMNFVTPARTASGSALVYKQSTDGPLTITCNGYVD